jgi:hypothetical protein
LASIFAEDPGTDMHERRGAGAVCMGARLRGWTGGVPSRAMAELDLTRSGEDRRL